MRAQDLGVSMLAGLAATWVMGQVTTALGDLQSPADKAREKAVSPGVAYEVAAGRTAKVAGIRLSDEARMRAGTVVHYGLGAGWAVAYPQLRAAGLGPLLAGVGTGLSLELIIDEGANTALGFSAPPQAYPASTHLRGFAGHAVYGALVAVFTEVGWWVLRR